MTLPWWRHTASALHAARRYRIIEDRESKDPYLIRYYAYDCLPLFRIFLHRTLRSDMDGLHDHPWFWISIILEGGYWETVLDGPLLKRILFPGSCGTKRLFRAPGTWRICTAWKYHHLEVPEPHERQGEEVWSMFIRFFSVKDWGFLNENGYWEQWEKYLDRKKAARIAREMAYRATFSDKVVDEKSN